MEYQDLDQIRINFNEDQLWMLNICIALIMFGVALHLKKADFNEIRRHPRTVLVGLVSQLLLLPIFTLLIIWIFQLPYSISLGLVLVACCPGGNISNFASTWAGANATLSVTLTSIITTTAALLTPLEFYIWTRFLPHEVNLNEIISVDFWTMFKTVVLILFIPLVLGILFKMWKPKFTNKIRKVFSLVSILILLIFIIVALARNFEYLWSTLTLLIWLVIMHNGIGFLVGYYFSRASGESVYNSKAISLETGIQNAGLALVIIFNFFPTVGGMMIVAAWWGVWNIASALILSSFWKVTSKNEEKEFLEIV